MLCQKCGKELPPDSNFCDGCGAKVEVYQNYSAGGQSQQQFNSSSEFRYTNNTQPPYTQPNYAVNNQRYEDTSVMTVGQYILTFFLCALPVVGFILTLIWAFGGDVNVNKRNYCRAMLITYAIVIGLYVLLVFFIAFLVIMSGNLM